MLNYRPKYFLSQKEETEHCSIGNLKHFYSSQLLFNNRSYDCQQKNNHLKLNIFKPNI